jgi:hypothetical protein
LIFVLAALPFLLAGDGKLKSGLQPGERPGPYASVISTGPQRGQSYCFICDTADRPAVIVFARSLSDPLASLARRLDHAVQSNSKADLRAWITFLDADQLHFDPKLVAWSRQHALRSVPLGVFEDPVGPPSYRLSRNADVTVIFYVKQKTSATFAFAPSELDEQHITEMLKTLPALLAQK